MLVVIYVSRIKFEKVNHEVFRSWRNNHNNDWNIFVQRLWVFVDNLLLLGHITWNLNACCLEYCRIRKVILFQQLLFLILFYLRIFAYRHSQFPLPSFFCRFKKYYKHSCRLLCTFPPSPVQRQGLVLAQMSEGCAHRVFYLPSERQLSWSDISVSRFTYMGEVI